MHPLRPPVCKVNQAVLLQTGDQLELGFAKDGARGYIAVQGGFDVPEVLGSRSVLVPYYRRTAAGLPQD